MTSQSVVVKREQSTAMALPTDTMADLVRAGELLAQSGMFGINNPGAGFVVAATCRQQGISLMEFQRTYHIVGGRPSMRADAMLAELNKRGGKHRIIENSVTRAAIEIDFEGFKHTFEFTIDDAKRTGDCYFADKAGKQCVKDNWQKRPDDMLWARCISRAVRRLCPEIVAGLYTPEEVEDFAPAPRREPITITPEVVKTRTAAPVVANPEPVAVDFTVCPVLNSEFDGKPWREIDVAMLEGALTCGLPQITDGHKAEIRATIDELKAGDE